jgi:hypothetical protein
MTGRPTGELGDVIEAAAGELEDVDRGARGTGVEWSTHGIVFAAVEGNRAEFRLAPPVVAAALRTPSTQASARGGDWVAFAPAALDGHAIDRAEAWLASAWRRASQGDL